MWNVHILMGIKYDHSLIAFQVCLSCSFLFKTIFYLILNALILFYFVKFFWIFCFKCFSQF